MKILLLPFLLLLSFFAMAQSTQNPFYQHYEEYRQQGLEKRRFRQQDILPMILSLQNNTVFEVEEAGKSVQARDIYLLKTGNGKTSVLLWSQMHGNEPTATMAMMDVLNFFKAEGDRLEPIRQLLLKELSIYFIPMLNPDGAELYQRTNALGIDLNRDALRLQSPEARLLKSVRDRIGADWGFNLHDMDVLYSVGKTPKPATISFLAPPFNEEKSINPSRSRAMKLIVEMNRALQAYLPGGIGKWPDEFEPRAFGDNIQKWGTSTVLIESGGYKNDPEKQYIRKLNFVAIMQGLLSIASESYTAQDIEEYATIPENGRSLFHLLIRHAKVEVNGQEYVLDIGINRKEIELEGRQDFYYSAKIEEVGDLTVFYGYEEVDARGMQAVPGKVFPKEYKNVEEVRAEDIYRLIESGYTAVKVKELPAKDFTHLPLNMVGAKEAGSPSILPEVRPNFVLKKGGQVLYAVINGFVYHLSTKENGVKNALVGEN